MADWTADAEGGLLRQGVLHKKFHFDMANRTVMAQADGCCCISKFAAAGLYDVFAPDSFYASLSVAGAAVGAETPKAARMLGRCQAVTVSLSGGSALRVETFLDESARAVFQEYTYSGGEADGVPFRLDFGFLLKAVGGALEKTAANLTAERRKWGLRLEGGAGRYVAVACNAPLIAREVHGTGAHLAAEAALVKGGEGLRLAFFADECPDGRVGFDNTFAEAKANCSAYGRWLSENAAGEGLGKARRAACLNCGVSSYKDTGGFKGFFAGIHYAFPARTYYRDGYFTAIAVLPWRPDLVAEQLNTLAMGIGEDGTCPSAVIGKDAAFWPNHLDSPMYFVILLYDYIKATGDRAVLPRLAGGRRFGDWVTLIMDALLARTDETGLLYRESGNRRDWADNVFREGYVTYIEALLCHALFCAGELAADGKRYRAAYERAAASIEDTLWDEERGWYVNYKGAAHTERNLSIDTSLLAWWGIAREDRARRMLANMERRLETKNNAAQPFGDWGVMCCWPPYGCKAHLVEKSSYDYVYHNGSDWPFWSCVYAMAKERYGMDGRYAASRWFEWGLGNGWNTPVEYANPVTGRGSLLQGWSALGALFGLRTCIHK